MYENKKYYDVTKCEKTLLDLSQELSVEKFGILDDEGDWSYISDKSSIGENARFSYDTGIYGEESSPLQNDVQACDIKSCSIYDNGTIVNHKVIKVLAYKETHD